MDAKLLINLYAALVPLAVGVIWYNPYLLDRIWGTAGGLATAKMNSTKIAFTVVLTYIAGFYIARSLGSIVIHQHGIYSMLAGNPEMKDTGSVLYNTVQGLMGKYGHNFRTFKHGALHGSLTGVYLVLPILAVIGVVESKKISWILLHAAYWIICLAIMGGIVCEYMP